VGVTAVVIGARWASLQLWMARGGLHCSRGVCAVGFTAVAGVCCGFS
jgi:hypothetical protein